jgi:uncharacterized membrane protein
MAFAKPWPVRVAAGHFRTAISIVAGVLAYLLLPDELGVTTRSVVAWDLGALVLLVLAAVLFSREGDDASMEQNALQQQDGEWTMFWVTLAGVAFSFVALTTELAEAKEIHTFARSFRVGLVAGTLLISWLTTTRTSFIQPREGQRTLTVGSFFPVKTHLTTGTSFTSPLWLE